MADSDQTDYGADANEQGSGEDHAAANDGDAGRNDENGSAEPPPAQMEPLTIHVKNGQGFAVAFKIKPTTRLEKLMDAFADKCDRQPGVLRFLLDGQRVLPDHTPLKLDLEEGDTLEAYEPQIGGNMADNEDTDNATGADEQQDSGAGQAADDNDSRESAEPPQAQPDLITIKFTTSKGYEVSFKMKPTTMMGKAMKAFTNMCERQPGELRFLSDGKRVMDADTPESLEMENGDVVETYEEQTGGATA